jgi:hypothetical protein
MSALCRRTGCQEGLYDQKGGCCCCKIEPKDGDRIEQIDRPAGQRLSCPKANGGT